MSQEITMLGKILIKLKQLVENGSLNGGGSSGAAQETTLQQLVDNTDQLETLLNNDNYTYDLVEETTNGQTDTNNVVSVSVVLDGDGGTINGVSLPSGSEGGLSNDRGGLVTTAIPYTVPTGGNQRVIITYVRKQ